MARRGYSAEFRRKVLDLLAEGRKVVDVARDLDVPDQTIYNWRRQDRIDRGEEPGLTTAEKAELATANKKIAELEAELAAAKRALDLLGPVVPPKEIGYASRVRARLALAMFDHPTRRGVWLARRTKSRLRRR